MKHRLFKLKVKDERPVESKKHGAYVCPKCGEEIETEVYDSDTDFDSICHRFGCKTCGHAWMEYFIMAYDGYADETGDYDKDGRREW